MRKVAGFLLWGLIAGVALGGALFGYFVYTPAPEAPRLSGQITSGSIEAGGRTRTYSIYIPHGLAPGAPLVVVMHGSGGTGAQMRRQTGYGFDRLADEHGFAVVYPDGYEGYWNGCNIVGDYAANVLNIDDVEFLTAMVDEVIADIGADPDRVFGTGISRGGHMAYRLALEAPARFRAVAAIGASVPTPENFKCTLREQGTSSVMIMNGTSDPLNPFGGGEVTFLGLVKRGSVLASRESGRFLARLNAIPDPYQVTSDARVEQTIWRNASGVEIELVAVRGGGHVVPQPYWRYPRALGATRRDLNGPALIWEFFERQQPRAAAGTSVTPALSP